MDLEKYFDTVNQSKLIEVLSRTIKDGRVISLIHKYLKAGVVVRHKYEDTEIGVPQGGPLSPILSNIMLTELDIPIRNLISSDILLKELLSRIDLVDYSLIFCHR
jgi:retron-type reverse transcriptase